MRARLRALRTLLNGKPLEPTVMELPAIDADGDPCWLTVGRVPTASEAEWAMHPVPEMRAAYHVHAVMLARETCECAGYTLGWGNHHDEAQG